LHRASASSPIPAAARNFSREGKEPADARMAPRLLSLEAPSSLGTPSVGSSLDSDGDALASAHLLSSDSEALVRPGSRSEATFDTTTTTEEEEEGEEGEEEEEETSHRPRGRPATLRQREQQQRKQKKKNGKKAAEAEEAEEEEFMYEHMDITTNGFCLTLINDYMNQNIPLVKCWISNMVLDIIGWSDEMKLFVNANLRMDYYNSMLEVWEPMIEPWSLQLKYDRNTLDGHPKQAWALLASKQLKVNVTKPFVETLLNTIEMLSDEDNGNSDESTTTKREKAHPYIIRNDTGLGLWYWLSGVEPALLKNGCEVPLVLHPHHSKRRTNEVHQADISLQLEGEYTPVVNIPIDKVSSGIGVLREGSAG
jgi:hypothetical protein